MSNPFALCRFRDALLGALLLACAWPAQAGPQSVITPVEDFPTTTELTFQALVLPAWAGYSASQPELATLSALIDFILVAGMAGFYGETVHMRDDVITLLGMMMAGHRGLAALLAPSIARQYQRTGTPKAMKTGPALGLHGFAGMGGYQEAILFGLGYSFEHFRISAGIGGGFPLFYTGPKGEKPKYGEDLEKPFLANLGLEGRIRLNPLMRVLPGIQVSAAHMARVSYTLPDTGWGPRDTVSSEEFQDFWVIPSLAMGFDPFRFFSMTLGMGYEFFRPARVRAFQKRVDEHGPARRKELDRLRFHAQAELYF